VEKKQLASAVLATKILEVTILGLSKEKKQEMEGRNKMFEKIRYIWYAGLLRDSSEDFAKARERGDFEAALTFGADAVKFGKKVVRLEERLNPRLDADRTISKIITEFERTYHNYTSTVPYEVAKS